MKSLNDKEIIEKIDTSVNQMDSLRGMGLNDFDNIQSVKNEISLREQKRLTEKYGKAHPRVIQAESRNKYYGQMVIGLESEKEKATLKTEKFEANSWRLHGKVFDEKLNPIEGLTIYFSDSNKQWIEQLGSYCTDKIGYFTLTITEHLIEKLKDMPIFTSVSDKNKKVICIAKNAVQITKSKIDYIEILIKDGGCVEPPTRGESNPTIPGKDNPKPKEPIVSPTDGSIVKPAEPILPKKEETKPTRNPK